MGKLDRRKVSWKVGKEKRGLSGREFQFELNWPRGKIICSIGRHQFLRDYCLTSTDHMSRGILGIKNKSRTFLGWKKEVKIFKLDDRTALSSRGRNRPGLSTEIVSRDDDPR